MGLIHAATSAISGTISEQWKEYFYCDSLPQEILMKRGQKKLGNKHSGSNTKGDDNIISNGSVIAVADGQCMLIVEQGKVVELCAEPGEFVWDSSTEPSIFAGNLGTSIKQTFETIGKRIAFGGTSAKDQRVYYINTKEIMGNKYGTANPVPFRVVDANIHLDMEISVRCFGEYSFRIADPILFYTNVCGNSAVKFERSQIEGQMKSELLSALQPAFAKISGMGIRYSAIVGHTMEVSDALDELLSDKWGKIRGIDIVSFGISSLSASEEDEATIKMLQKAAAAAQSGLNSSIMATATATAMNTAAANTNGAAMAFMGMNMAQQAGVNTANAFNNQAVQPMQQNYNVAQNGGFAQPAQQGNWFCPECGTANTGKFCTNCGTKKPEAASGKCPTCGTAYDPANPPKFCSNCGTKLQ